MKNQTNIQVITASASFVHNSPRKLQLVANAVKNMKPLDAVATLKLMPQRAAKTLLEVYQQALGNAKNNFQLSTADLRIHSLQILGGPRGSKKADVHAHGARFDRGVRRKRLAHIKLELVAKEKNGTKS